MNQQKDFSKEMEKYFPKGETPNFTALNKYGLIGKIGVHSWQVNKWIGIAICCDAELAVLTAELNENRGWKTRIVAVDKSNLKLH